MKATWKVLLEKSKQAMISAVSIYNNPSITFKSELFIVNSQIAWTYLLHAYYEKINVNYYYRRKQPNGKFRYDKVDGRRKEWELKQCVNALESPIDEATKKNLEILIKIRNSIEHSSYIMNDDLISAKIQACSLNFNFYIKQLFGNKYGLDKVLNMSIQFSALNPEQRKLLMDKKAKDNVVKIISEYEKNLSEGLIENLRYSYRVLFVENTAKRENQADRVIHFVRAESEESNAIQVANKETKKPKIITKDVVKKIQEAGFPKFTINKHTDLWKNLNAKDPSKKYGTDVAGKWYWYQVWIDFAIKHLKNKQLGVEQDINSPVIY